MVLERLVSKLLNAFVSRGTLRVMTETGQILTAGDGTSPEVHVRLVGPGAARTLLRDPELTLGELFTDGRLVLDTGTLPELFQLLLQDSHGDRSRFVWPWAVRLRAATRRLLHANDPASSRRNVHHHYDLSDELYDLFLDRRRQYSCAYFERPEASLDEAQVAKMRHIAAKLAVEPGSRVLDIGSGWGGLATYLVETAGAGRVKGITLSDEQLKQSRRNAAERGLSQRLSFELEDYRSTAGTFDRIVSVGMFEHVGEARYPTFFQTAARLLDERGVMLLHTIGRTGRPGYTNPWIRKYIFPGGHVPSLSEIVPSIERAGLAVTDVEILRLHYAETLKAWRERFLVHREEAARLYDERFCRMWDFYLAVCEAAFRYEDLVVFQLQLTRRNDTVPLTRAYIAEREELLRERERQAGGDRFREAAE